MNNIQKMLQKKKHYNVKEHTSEWLQSVVYIFNSDAVNKLSVHHEELNYHIKLEKNV